MVWTWEVSKSRSSYPSDREDAWMPKVSAFQKRKAISSAARTAARQIQSMHLRAAMWIPPQPM